MEEEKKDNLENTNMNQEQTKGLKRKGIMMAIIVLIVVMLVVYTIYTNYNNKEKNKAENKTEIKNEENQNNENHKTDVAEEGQDNTNEFEEENIKMNEKEIKKLSSTYISYLNPMENNCISTKIDKNCLSDDDIANIVFEALDEDKKLENREDINDGEWNDYISYDIYKQYVKNMFSIEDYEIPKEFNTMYQYCHKYTNTGQNIKRYTNGPGCSFGAHAITKIDQWSYKFENYVEEKNNIVVTVVAMYEYNEDVNTNPITIYTDKNKTVSVEDDNDTRLKRLSYTFIKGDNYLTLISIENK